MKERELTDMHIDDIKITNRYRKDLGDIKSLAKSIEDVGCLNPITVTYDNELLAGQRRIEAHRLLGLTEIPALKVKDLTTAVKFLTAERDENEERKEMTVSEKVALAQALEEMERPKAAERQRDGQRRGRNTQHGKANRTGSSSRELEPGQTRDIVGRAVGMAGVTYQKARMVVRSATDPDLPPEVKEIARQAMTDMDNTGVIQPAYDKVRAARDPQPKPPRTVSAVKQRKALTNADHTLSGIAMGLDQITDAGLSEEITSDEAARWVDGLVKSRRSIERLINLLRERSNG